MNTKNNIIVKMIIDILQAMVSQLLVYTYVVAYGGPSNGTGFGNWFCKKYLRLRLLHHPLLCGNYMP